jgi:hypothetical protein
MLRTSKRKGSLQVMLMVLAVLLVGITATGYGDDGSKTDDHDDGKKHLGLGPTERLSGPALVGTLTLVQLTPDDTFVAFSGTCEVIPPESLFFTDDLTVAKGSFVTVPTTAKSLKGLRLIREWPSGCPVNDLGGEDAIVVDVKRRMFAYDGISMTASADVVLLRVVPRLHKDEDKDKDKDKDKDNDKDKH